MAAAHFDEADGGVMGFADDTVDVEVGPNLCQRLFVYALILSCTTNLLSVLTWVQTRART